MKTIQANQTPEFQDWLRGLLHDEHTKDLCVTFTKKDGTERTMRCTLVESRIPSEKTPHSKETSTTTSGSALRVFDEEKQEWRSFRWDSIKEVKFSL
jgi:hypothetical protein